MYAIIKTGGKQYSVTPGDRLYIERLDVEEGDSVEFDKVLYLSTDDSAETGTPYLDAVRVMGTVVENGKAKKVVIFKYKAKKDYRKKQGHRQPYTLVEIESVKSGGKIIAVKPVTDVSADEDARDGDGDGDVEEKTSAVTVTMPDVESVEPKTENIESETGKEDVKVVDAVEKPAAKRTTKAKTIKAETDTSDTPAEKPAVKKTAKPKTPKAAAEKSGADTSETKPDKPAAKRTPKPKAEKSEEPAANTENREPSPETPADDKDGSL
jgi:large subunit ribosomal protein L21